VPVYNNAKFTGIQVRQYKIISCIYRLYRRVWRLCMRAYDLGKV